MTDAEWSSRLEEARKFVCGKAPGFTPALGFILGSGLSGFASRVKVRAEIRFADIPGFAVSTVSGHPGKLILGTLEGVDVCVLAGRLHAYEGLSLAQVIYPVRTLSVLGVKTLVVTNAAGGLRKSMKGGQLMIIEDHLNLTGMNALVGENWSVGPRFVDMTAPYDPELSKLLAASMRAEKVRHSRGVYVGVMGPTYETAAEIKFYARMGGGAVGMSTVHEVIAARHAGLRVAGVSCVTNLGTGLSKTKLTHEEVKEAAHQMEDGFTRALVAFTRKVKPRL